MAYTTPKTWTASSALTAAELQEQVSDNITDLNARLTLHGLTSSVTVQPVLTGRYGCSFYITGQTVTSGSDVSINFTEASEEWKDFAGMHSNSAQARFYPRATGTFLFTGWAQFAAHAQGRREVWLQVNDATDYNRIRIPAVEAAAATALLVTCEIPISSTADYVKLMVRQSSGTSLDVNARLQMRRIAS